MKYRGILAAVAAAVLGASVAYGAEARNAGTTFARDALKPWIESGELPGCVSVFYNNGVQEVACLGYADASIDSRNGMIRSYWGDETTGARRRYYAITETGLEKLNQDCAAWEETKTMMDRLLKEDVE